MLIKLGVSAPAPADAAKRAELATLTTELDAMYGEGKYCPRAPTRTARRPTARISTSSAKPSPPAATTRSSPRPGRAGTRSRKPMRPKYQRFVELANEGARELGFDDLGVLWRSRYDMPAADFEKEADAPLRPGRSRCTRACTATRASACSSATARTRCPTASRSRRTCSATCGRSSGTASTTTC